MVAGGGRFGFSAFKISSVRMKPGGSPLSYDYHCWHFRYCHMNIVDIFIAVVWSLLLTFYCCHMIIVDILVMTSMLMRWLVPDKEQRANIYSKDVLCFTLHNILWSLSLIADRVFLIFPGFGCAADYSQTGVSRWITPQATEKANNEKRSHPHWSIKH